MKKKIHITYLQLLQVISLGLVKEIVKQNQLSGCQNLKPIKGAEYNGIYIGSPGRDIYFMLPYLSEKQMKEVAINMNKYFPKIPPKNNVNVSACIRFIYGQFEKQGILKSDKQFEKMKKKKPDWKLSRKFLKILYKIFEEQQNFYGLTILCEIEGHRLGDEALIYKNKKKLKEMEKKYLKCIEFAHNSKSYKHMFTPYFWAFKYFKKFGNKEKALKYSKLLIENANEYCERYVKTKELAYILRISESIKYIKEKSFDNGKKLFKKYKTKIKSKHLREAFRMAKI